MNNNNLFEDSFQQFAETIFNLVKKEKYDELLKSFTCLSIPPNSVPFNNTLKLELRSQMGIGDESKIYIVSYENPRDYNIFKYLHIECSAFGAWQSYLLHKLWHILPLYWHGLYGKRKYILTTKDLKDIKPIPKEEKQKFNVSPYIKQEGNVFYVSCCYWSEFSGLVRETVEIKIENNKAVTLQFLEYDFEPDNTQHEVLYEYNCGILY